MSTDGGATSPSGTPQNPFESGLSQPPASAVPNTPSYPSAALPGSVTPDGVFGSGPAAPAGTPPPGYVAYGDATSAPMEATNGLGTAVIVLFWINVALAGLATIALFSRRGTWDDFLAGSAGFSDLDDADGFVAVTALMSLAMIVVAGIVVSIWSLRAARNFKALGAHEVSPGWACGGWYIPIANLFVPFIQLRKGITATGGDTHNVLVWQVLFIAAAITGQISSQAFDGSDTFAGTDEVRSQLTTQATSTAIQTALLIGAAFFAMKAITASNNRFTRASASDPVGV